MIEVNKIAIPFAQSGNKSIIYDNRQSGQAENEATWSTGFPPITMIRKEDGGLPPTGLDFNGIFYDISSNVVFACMGGQYKFDAEYAEKIGGYPKGAILLNDEENKQYISNIDNNKVDFNSADPVKLTQWSVITIADIDKLLNEKVTNTDFSQALNQKANTSTNINAGNGLTGGGNLTTSRTIELGTPTAITQSSTNSVTATSHTHSISKATTEQEGIVQLTNVLGTSTSLVATQKLVNDTKINLENSKQDKLTFVGDGPEVMKAGAFGLGETQGRNYYGVKSSFVGYYPGSAGADEGTPIRTAMHGIRCAHSLTNNTWFEVLCDHNNLDLVVRKRRFDNYYVADILTSLNTSADKSGFLRVFGSANALTTSDVTQSLGNSSSLVASQALVNNVNSKIKLNTASKSQNGWWKCGETGVIYQWGSGITLNGETEVNFPISFSSACFSVIVTINRSMTQPDSSFSYDYKKESFKTFVITPGGVKHEGPISYIAVGY